MTEGAIDLRVVSSRVYPAHDVALEAEHNLAFYAALRGRSPALVKVDCTKCHATGAGRESWERCEACGGREWLTREAQPHPAAAHTVRALEKVRALLSLG